MSAEGLSTVATGPPCRREVVTRSSECHGLGIHTGRVSGQLLYLLFLSAVRTGSPHAMLEDAQQEAASLAFIVQKPGLEVIMLQGREPAKGHVQGDRGENPHDQGAGRGW